MSSSVHDGSERALPDDYTLPELRQELTLSAGEVRTDGTPSWLIEDPLRHRFFQIGQFELNALSAWPAGTVGELEARLRMQLRSASFRHQLLEFLTFLQANSLLVARGERAVEMLLGQAEKAQRRWWQWLVHHYLFVRIPLARPNRFLQRTRSAVAPLYTRTFFYLWVAVTLCGMFMALQQWPAFKSTFLHFLSLSGLSAYLSAIVFIKILHELGHAYTAVRYGCRVPTIGVAFLVLVPVLYTDTSDAWRLADRRKRIAIDAAGIAVELMIAGFATFAWAFLPEGPLKSVAFVLATTSWLLSLSVNLNPFMRFDGYYLLADAVGVSNLQPRAFAVGRYVLRELLFGLGDDPPEYASGRRTFAMAVYAYATWIYRLILFIGIAVLVYGLFFKALGVLLFVVEIAWFIAIPVWRELMAWWAVRMRIFMSSRTYVSATIFAGCLWLFFWPWQTTVRIDAVAGATAQVPVHAPHAAIIVRSHLTDQKTVRRGDVLIELKSPALEQELVQSKTRVALLEARLRRRPADTIDRAHSQVIQRERDAELERIDGLRAQIDALTLRAPIDGQVRDLQPQLRAGRWVRAKLRLARVVSLEGVDMRGFVRHVDAWRVAPGETTGRFIADDPTMETTPVKLASVAPTAVSYIDVAYLASDSGGPIATALDERERPVAREAHHKVTLVALHPLALPYAVRGKILLDGASQSYAARVRRHVLQVLSREAGL